MADVDRHCARARKAGTKIIEEPQDTRYGARRYGAEDREGHQWYFATARMGVERIVRVNLPSQLRALLARHDKDVQALALGLRDLVIAALAPCHEYAFQMRSKTVLLYGATTHAIEDNICNIAVLRQHVTLTFRHGAELRDPHALLRGTGRIMRHIRIERREDLKRSELSALIREARRHAEAEGLAARGRNDRTVTTRIKERKPPER